MSFCLGIFTLLDSKIIYIIEKDNKMYKNDKNMKIDISSPNWHRSGATFSPKK